MNFGCRYCVCELRYGRYRVGYCDVVRMDWEEKDLLCLRNDGGVAKRL
jgi:hypothetical protein